MMEFMIDKKTEDIDVMGAEESASGVRRRAAPVAMLRKTQQAGLSAEPLGEISGHSITASPRSRSPVDQDRRSSRGTSTSRLGVSHVSFHLPISPFSASYAVADPAMGGPGAPPH